MIPTITLAHIERLGFTVNRYDTARQAWADSPTEGNAAIGEAMRAAVVVRAVLCGMPDGVDPVAWANRTLGRFWGAVTAPSFATPWAAA
jgi:hypothetical protein